MSRSSSLGLAGRGEKQGRLAFRYSFSEMKERLVSELLRFSHVGGGSAVIFGFMSGGNGGFTSGFGDRYGGMLLPGVMGGVGFPGTGEWG